MIKFGYILAVVLLIAPVLKLEQAIASIPDPIRKKAAEITVRIIYGARFPGEKDDPKVKDGSGVLIKHEGNTYTVLTAWHVVKETGNYTIITADGKFHIVADNQVQHIGKVDLAELQFTSNDNYDPVELGDSNKITAGDTVYIFGWADSDKGTNDPQYIVLEALARLVNHPLNEYALNLNSSGVRPGMSGGPILNEQGLLIGVTGKTAEVPRMGEENDVIPVLEALGIPINIYKQHIDFSLRKTLEGHSNWVRSVAISPDGKTLVSGSLDNTIKIWNLETGQLLHTLSGHSDWVLSVAISPDGKTLVSGSLDNTIKIWNLETGQLLHTLSGHSGSVWSWVLSVAISPDGKTLVSGSLDNTIEIWNLETGQLLHTLSGNSGWVLSVAISPDGKTLVSGSLDNTIKIWNLETGQLLHTLSGHSDWVLSVAISPDGKTLVSGSLDNTIKIWNLETGQLLHTLDGHSSWVLSVAISPDGKTLVSGSLDNTIKIWNLETGQLLHTLDGHSDGVLSVAISPDGKTLVSGSLDNTIKIWRKSDE